MGRIDASLRRSVYLEQGYGQQFGMPDGQLAGQVAGMRSRAALLADCDVILLPKPLPEDLRQMRQGQVLWGWPHCVQNADITQLAIDRQLTLIAFEAMQHWSGDGSFHLHVFYKNNELAGYCSVLHAMQLIGTTCEYGRPLRAVVISFGRDRPRRGHGIEGSGRGRHQHPDAPGCDTTRSQAPVGYRLADGTRRGRSGPARPAGKVPARRPARAC